MTELPILFSGAMVRAILEGRKTQTRRVVNGVEECPHGYDGVVRATVPKEAHLVGKHCFYLASGESLYLRSPYGAPGDRLWVRETTAIVAVDGGTVSIARAERMPAGKTLADTDGGLELFTVDRETAAWAAERVDCERWRPSIFMPRWACRLVLEVTGVRVERLQDITYPECLAEGFEKRPGITDELVHRDAARDWYMDLWDSLNGKRGFGWSVNPWVWTVEFRRAAGKPTA